MNGAGRLTVTPPRGRVARVLRPWAAWSQDALDLAQRFVVAGPHHASLPPRSLRDVGPGDLQAIGREFLGHFVALAALPPADCGLDIGCGPGRMALRLTRYLTADGRYAGVDVVAPAIPWCQRRISRRYSNFTFLHADVFNQRYNRGRRIQVRDHVFARLLRPVGRVFSTWFLLNAVRADLVAHGWNLVDFRFDGGGYRIRDESLHENAVAIEERSARAMLAEAGLTIREPIRFGRWTGRPVGLSFENIVLAARS
jgi:SAM-dependent methyltransferase